MTYDEAMAQMAKRAEQCGVSIHACALLYETRWRGGRAPGFYQMHERKGDGRYVTLGALPNAKVYQGRRTWPIDYRPTGKECHENRTS